MAENVITLQVKSKFHKLYEKFAITLRDTLKLFNTKMSSFFGHRYMVMPIRKCSLEASLPHKATAGSAGYDLFAAESVLIPAGETRTIDTKLQIALPDGFYIKIGNFYKKL